MGLVLGEIAAFIAIMLVIFSCYRLISNRIDRVVRDDQEKFEDLHKAKEDLNK